MRSLPKLLPLFGVGLLLFSLARGTSYLTYGLYVAFLALLAAHLMALLALDRVRCTRNVTVDRANIGDTLEVSTVVHNEKPLPVVWLLAEELLPANLPWEGNAARLFVLRPHRSARLTYRVTFDRRGYHQFGPVLLESGDLFGFVRKFAAVAPLHFVTVRPRVYPIFKYDLASHRPVGEIRVKRQIFEDPSRMVGIREYATGDSLSRIHWKATARVGRLQSKVYEPSMQAGSLLVLDFSRDAYHGPAGEENAEFAVEVAASLANYLYEMKQTVGLVSNGVDAAQRARQEARVGRAQTREEALRLARPRELPLASRPAESPPEKTALGLARLLDLLARLELSRGPALDELLFREHIRFPRDLALIVITPRVCSDLLYTLARVKLAGFAVTVVLIRAPEQFREVRAALAAQGIAVRHVCTVQDLSALAATPL